MTLSSRARRARTDQSVSSRVPAVLVPPGLIAFFFLLLPLLGLLIRAPWRGLASIYADAAVADALRLSLTTSVQATAACLLLGIPLGWLLARLRVPGIGVARAVVMLPLVLPPVVGGVALLLTLGRNGYVGRYLDQWFDIQLPFTSHGVVIAEAFVAMPFLVITVEGAFRASDRGLEEAAATLGASRWRIFTRVTLPAVAPSLAAGTALCWARAIGEFGATITFAGNLPGRTRTMPSAIYLAFEQDPEAAVALSLVLMLVAVVVLAALRDRWLRAGVA
ncbi:MAG: molybdate ABC transporter permease subunit [Actinomycetota bacterium]